MMIPGDANFILVDAHVHIRKNYKADKYFAAAFNNFRKISINYGDRPKKNVGILCLTETNNAKVFQDLRELTESKVLFDGFHSVKNSLYKTREDVSLRITSRHEENIYVIAGRQIVSRENIEVLALGALNKFEDGRSIDKLITEISDQSAIPVLPWGFGKWLGDRGRVVKNMLHNPKKPALFIGDNGNRPKFFPEPAIFKLAERMKVKNLAGSDPLPAAGEYRRPGSYGFSLKGSLDTDHPWKDLKHKLLDPATQFEYFGALESPWRFIRNQIGMQYHKRFCG